jgi:hypothetical protein
VRNLFYLDMYRFCSRADLHECRSATTASEAAGLTAGIQGTQARVYRAGWHVRLLIAYVSVTEAIKPVRTSLARWP